MPDVQVVLVIFALVVVAFVVTGVRIERQLKLQGYDRSRKPPEPGARHSFDPSRSAVLRGGSRVGRWNATVPLVALTIDEEYAHLSGIWPVWIPRSGVERVHRVRGMFGGGLRFQTAIGDFDGVIFWTFEPVMVERALKKFGWP